MANVLVTGGAGYVGSHACKAIAAAGHIPITYDNLVNGHRTAVKWGPLEVGDILDHARLLSVLESYKPVAVMHFAALAMVSESVSNPELYYSNNVEGTSRLLSAMESADIHRLVFSSSCAVYGAPKTVPIQETEDKNPISPYGETKLQAERMFAARAPESGLSAISLRYFNAAGADPDGDIGEDHDPEPHLIPNVLAAAAGGSRLIVNGDNYPTIDGTCVRDYVHVSDIAAAHVAALDLLDEISGVRSVNLGTGTGYSILQIIEAAKRVTGKPISYDIGAARPGDPPELVADASHATAMLNWKPVRSDIDSIVADAWNWMTSK
ncbi:MAG: UDP-glucose 4-epimerase GalE [Alphaproteobacteria bacterium]|nr:UDP-glucose 4-epimerase GalE [Alphaproteobacteria bacterium]